MTRHVECPFSHHAALWKEQFRIFLVAFATASFFLLNSPPILSQQVDQQDAHQPDKDVTDSEIGKKEVGKKEPHGKHIVEPEKTLVSAREVRVLSSEQAGNRKSVHLTGVVTHANPHIGDFFIHDGTSPIYVQPNQGKNLKMGDLAEVRGLTSAGDYAPCILPTSVKKIGTAKLPDPLPYDLNVDDSRWLDAQWVLCWVVVRRVEARSGYTLALLEGRNGTATLLMPGEDNKNYLQSLIDAPIRVTGVCVPSFNDRRVVDKPPRIFVQGPDNLVTLERNSVDLGKKSALLIEQLLSFSPDPYPGARRVRVIGKVTARDVQEAFFIRDSTASARVVPVANADYPPGTNVEVLGLLEVHGPALTIKNATVEITGKSDPPAPQPASIAEVLAGRFAHELVLVPGRVTDFSRLNGHRVVTLQSGVSSIEVLLSPNSPDLPRDSRVNVTGIAVPTDASPPSFRLLVRNASDVHILELPPLPPWWSTTRALIVLGGVACTVLICLVWVATLRIRIQQQTAQLRASFEKENELSAQLRQSQKLEAIGRLAGGIAHDFNNLLTVISTCSQLLKQTYYHNEDAGELVNAIAKASERASALTNQLLLFSRDRPVHLEPLFLNDVINDSVILMRRLIGENIELEIQLAKDLPPIHADSGLMHQILLNLAVNARDAIADMGTITIKTEALENGQQRLTFRDTGCGMDEATKARLFEPFFTTKQPGKGTGLGLACVYGIVQTLKGQIRVDSLPGEGATWEIDLPPTTGNEVQPVVKTEKISSTNIPTKIEHSLKDAVVLVVEDEPAVREMVKLILAGNVREALVASKPSDALRIAADYPGTIDILLTDVVMPEMNGRVLADKLHEQHPGLPVLFTSGYAPDEVLRQGLEAEKVHFLAKPYRPDMLLKQLEEVYRKNCDSRQ